MDSLIFPRSLILEKALDALTFDEPYYLYEPWDDGLFRCQIKFNPSTSAMEQMPDTIYEVWSGWFSSTEEAKENAAHRALTFLETIAVFHIQDYSFSIIQRLKPQNHHLSKQCHDAAKAIERLLYAWSAMTSDINKTSLLCSACIAENDVGHDNIQDNHLLHSTLYQISKLSTSLSNSYEKNMKNFRRYYRPISDLLKKHLIFNTESDIIDPGEPTSTTVIIPATDMLAYILLLLQADTPEYNHMEQNDGTVITRCTFYKDAAYLPNISIEEVYGPPSATIELSQQTAALKSLQHLDTLYQLHLNDYNYETKESLIDENRSLIRAKSSLISTLVDIYNTMQRDSLVELQSIIQSAYHTISTASQFPTSTEEFKNIIVNIMQSMDNIYNQLLKIYSDANQMMENHGAIQVITSKMYSYIV